MPSWAGNWGPAVGHGHVVALCQPHLGWGLFLCQGPVPGYWLLHSTQRPLWHSVTPLSLHITYFPMRGTAWEVSGTFWAMRKRKTVWARRTLMETVHFCPPAAKEGGRQRLARGTGVGIALLWQKAPTPNRNWPSSAMKL